MTWSEGSPPNHVALTMDLFEVAGEDHVRRIRANLGVIGRDRGESSKHYLIDYKVILADNTNLAAKLQTCI